VEFNDDEKWSKCNIIYRKTAAKAAHTIALCRLFSVLLLTIQSDSFT